jgi:hypothetical protein
VEAVRCGLGLGGPLPANALETLERVYIFARRVLENTVEQLPAKLLFISVEMGSRKNIRDENKLLFGSSGTL